MNLIEGWRFIDMVDWHTQLGTHNLGLKEKITCSDHNGGIQKVATKDGVCLVIDIQNNTTSTSLKEMG